jgi:transcriptional regulator with XRE-family HTH domain
MTKARMMLHISQEQLAAKTGFSRPMLGNLETGRRNTSIKNWLVIGEALGVDYRILRRNYTTQEMKKFIGMLDDLNVVFLP